MQLSKLRNAKWIIPLAALLLLVFKALFLTSVTSSAAIDNANNSLEEKNITNVSAVDVRGVPGFGSDGLQLTVKGPAEKKAATLAALADVEGVDEVVYETNDTAKIDTDNELKPASNTTTKKTETTEDSETEQPVDTDVLATEELNDLFALEPIQFNKNLSTINILSNPTIDEAAKILKANPELTVTVVGHTDTDGDSTVNLTLSQARSEAVVNYLVNRSGIDAERLTAVGKGETEPLVSPEKTSEDKQKNRRIAWEIKK